MCGSPCSRPWLEIAGREQRLLLFDLNNSLLREPCAAPALESEPFRELVCQHETTPARPCRKRTQGLRDRLRREILGDAEPGNEDRPRLVKRRLMEALDQ